MTLLRTLQCTLSSEAVMDLADSPGQRVMHIPDMVAPLHDHLSLHRNGSALLETCAPTVSVLYRL